MTERIVEVDMTDPEWTGERKSQMPSEGLKPCPWCEGETRAFEQRTMNGTLYKMVVHQGWPHCCVRRDSMTLGQWNTRTATQAASPDVEIEGATKYTLATSSQAALSDVIERVALAYQRANSSGCVSYDAIEAALAAIPTAGRVEEIWAALTAAGHVSPDGTYLQCGYTELCAALSAARDTGDMK